tara:strand:- start:73 stop:300 length:228 start_codon:yes stop_codon:yes gene_type:complete
MNLLKILTLGAAKDPELAPHAYLFYLLAWTFFVGLFVLFVFPLIGKTLGFIVITILILLFVGMVSYFHKRNLFAD